MAKVKRKLKQRPKAKHHAKVASGMLLSPYYFGGPGKIDPERLRAAIREVMARRAAPEASHTDE